MMFKIIGGIIAVIGIFAFAANAFRADMKQTGKQTAPSSDPKTTNSLTLKGGTHEVVTEEPVYSGSTKGFFAKPKEEGTYPGVVMIHEWWGLNDNMKVMAQKLASDGYMVLAVDLYNGQTATDPQQAQALTSQVDETLSIGNMQDAVLFLKEKGAVKIGSLGWCFGGGQSLRLALSSMPLDATAIYYGNLETDQEKLSAITWPVLGVFGDKDESISVNTVKRFESALNNLGVENEIYIYPGVGHAFANPTGENYAPGETEDAWNKTVQFFNRALKSEAT
jgi:carboxymethylenebutenolidase